MKRNLLFIVVCFIISVSAYSQQENEARLLRFPAIYKNQVVFTYAGDLYTVDRKGGTARKLTNDAGYEMFAKFSPDGKNISFTGQYDGNTEVYLIPSEGGVPKRLTYTATLSRDDISDRMGPNNIVMTWKDNNNVVYRSRKKSFNAFKGQLFVANVNGGLSEELPFPVGGFCSYSADRTKLAYNRVFREFRTWKYYKGGMADDVWIYDFKTKKIDNITNNTSQDIFPMWKDNTIFYLSDRDRRMNLFSYNIDTKETKKITNFTDYDVKFPSLGDDAVIFENGGYLYTYTIASGALDKISIKVADDQNASRSELIDASKFVKGASVSPDGKRVAFEGRGDIWSVPAKTGITMNLTQSSTAYERNVTWSPDGKMIAYISDITGEDEIYIMNQDGNSKPEKLTQNADTYKYRIIWSPDSKKLLWADKKLRLQYVEIARKKVTLVDQDLDWEFSEYTWSPDNKWISYTRPNRDSPQMIYIYELATEKKTAVTSNWYDSSSPAFSDDGKYLFFTSNRDFNPIYSWTEWNTAYKNMSKVYFITLAKATPSPLRPENDVVDMKKDEAQKADKDKDKKDEKKAEVTVKIDLDGIEDRIVMLPVESSNYSSITAIKDIVYYVKGEQEEDEQGNIKGKLMLKMYNLKDKKEVKIGDINGYDITADSKKMLVVKDGKYAIIDLPSAEMKIDNYVDLSNMKSWVNLKEEWKQIFDQSWRNMRDFFYDPNMQGVNWNAMKEKYGQLVPFVNHRNDLNYIIGELIGELNIGHSYVGGGDRPMPKRISTGLLGAEISKDASGYYKINKILKGENWVSKTRSPLTEVGVDVNEGDFIIAVNGKPTNAMNDIYESLVNTAGKQVELTVNSKATEAGERKVIVVPTDDEAELYYYNWVENNIKKVNDATDGKVGYIHIPDMGPEGLNEFVKHFYPQLSKKALIIDDRGNGGGNVSPMIIERLKREIGFMAVSRNTRQSYSPHGMEVGPKVCLIDQYSASDGDLFPYQFKHFKIGKLIGLRTWGGVVGIRGPLPTIDGGFLMKPEFAHYGDNSQWIIEGHGVDPDIIVDNDPAKEYAGEDQQLNKAIEVIKEEMKSYNQELPAVPAYPDKTK